MRALKLFDIESQRKPAPAFSGYSGHPTGPDPEPQADQPKQRIGKMPGQRRAQQLPPHEVVAVDHMREPEAVRRAP